MTEIAIPLPMVSFAKKLAKEMGALRGSITGGKGNLAGHLGELMVFDIMGGEYLPTFDYDIFWKGKRFDVKSKNCTSIPREFFNCTVAAFNTKQQCDFYIFTRILDSLRTGWILGYLSKDEFYEKARFFKEGDYDPESFHRGMNGGRFIADCYNVRINELKPFEQIVAECS
jgi:hypothetical protein